MMADEEVNSIADGVQRLDVISGSDALQEEAPAAIAKPAQKPRQGKKAKKQKWKSLDLSAVPDPPAGQNDNLQRTSQASHSGGAWSNNQNPRDWGSDYSARGSRGGWSNKNYTPTYAEQRQEFARQAADVPKSKEDTVALSKALVRLLRHGNPSDILIDEEGYARIDDILDNRSFKRFHTSAREIEHLVAENDKKRYEIVYGSDNKPFKIKATQGHSIKFTKMEMTEIMDPRKYRTVVHGTYSSNWRKIKREGLKRFQRTHIHFAIGRIGETHVTSGMRVTCDIVIELDMEKAMKDGLRFFESSNQVVLTEGDKQGTVSPIYFKEVTKYDPNDGKFKPINFAYEG